MRTNWFAILLFFYAGFSIVGGALFSANAYIEQNSWNHYFTAHFIIRFIVALIAATLFFAVYKSAMPEHYAKRMNKLYFRIFAPVLLLLATFLMNTLVILPLNDIKLSTDKKITVVGTVSDKYFTSGSRGGHSYFLVVRDSRYRQYKLKVKKDIYQSYARDSAFDKTLTEGMLGIIYRKED